MKLYRSAILLSQVVTIFAILAAYRQICANGKAVRDNAEKVAAMWQQRIDGKTNADVARETK